MRAPEGDFRDAEAIDAFAGEVAEGLGAGAAGRPPGHACAAATLHTLWAVRYFQAVRLYSLVEVCVFAALLVVAIGGLGERAELVLGWTHGLGWIVLCLAVALGCAKRVFPWPLLAATVSPLGPVGSTIGLELLSRRRRGRSAARG